MVIGNIIIVKNVGEIWRKQLFAFKKNFISCLAASLCSLSLLKFGEY